jgi:hypothetical protein
MLKTKVDPAMCMKTQPGWTKWTVIDHPFWQIIHRSCETYGTSSGVSGRKCMDYAINWGEVASIIRAFPEARERLAHAGVAPTDRANPEDWHMLN